MNESIDLTGASRKLKDNVISWHNYTVRWNNLICSGIDNVKEICNYIIGNSTKDDTTGNYDEKLNEMFNPMDITIVQMQELVKKMSRLTSELKYLSETNDSGFINEDEQNLTRRRINKFYEISEELLMAYRKEFDVKNSCIKELARHRDRPNLMHLVGVWESQVYLYSVKFNIETMLQEMNLR